MIAKRCVGLTLVILGMGCSCKGDPGVQGLEGPRGHSALVSMSPEGPGPNCSGGGVVIRSGVDTDDDNTLDSSEVTSTAYACHGSADSPALVLAKLLTVDGTGSQLDAQYVEGKPARDLGVPPGTVVAYAGSNTSTAPDGWLFCDGAEYPNDDYPALRAALGTNHGSSTGSSFRVPDLRGRFLRGADLGAARDPDRNSRTQPAAGGVSGNAVGSVQSHATARPTSSSFTTDTQGNHTHGVGAFNQLLRLANGNQTTSPGTPDVSPGEPDVVSSASEVGAGNHAHTVTGGGDSETRPANVYVNYIIKT